MICPSCIILPIAALGISISFTDKYVIGMLLTIFSLSLYLYIKDIKKCKKCKDNKCYAK